MPHGHPQTQVEQRGRAVGGRAPTEVIFEGGKLDEGEEKKKKNEGAFPDLSDAVLDVALPTISYLDLKGNYKDTDFAPPDLETVKGVDYRIVMAGFYAQSPYSDLTWLTTPFMPLIGFLLGAREARLRARKTVDYASKAAALGKENEELKKALADYAQQTQTPGQMGGGYAARDKEVQILRAVAQPLMARELGGILNGGYVQNQNRRRGS